MLIGSPAALYRKMTFSDSSPPAAGSARDTSGAVSDLNGKPGGSIPCQFTWTRARPTRPR